MAKDVYRYVFDEGVPVEDAEESLLLAVLATECLHGESRVRLDAGYFFDKVKRACVVDATTDVGRDICRIFTGFVSREFGEDSFRVERVEGAAEEAGE